ncbi:hypothetical protein MKY41_03920 [Sporosarcina sp. FSL W7-1349]|uniref:hypothetical protein n=1 Tax=Sporosarcina sp. FSL W7-1349 TaxID=2921561 RepID=UPI0030F9A33F
MTSQFTWSTDWMQEYESPWGILEKFMWANAIDGNTVLELVGNENVKRLKNISNAGSRHRSLISFMGMDSKVSKNIIGMDLKVYHDNLVDKVMHITPHIKHVGNYYQSNLFYCPICLSRGYHSILHQLRMFDHCAFHPEQELMDRCEKCNQLMPEYLINRSQKEAFRCNCGHHFLNSDNIRSIFSSWTEKPKIKNKTISSWLKLSKDKVHKYYVIYPFDNYEKYQVVDNKDYLRFIPKLLVKAFSEDAEDALNNEAIKISSQAGIFNIKNNYQQLKDIYTEAFPYLFSSNNFTEKHKDDSIYFEIYKQTRIIYKAITRYILRKTIKEHSKCVKIFNKARQNGDICPHALAFISWKLECEGIDASWKIERRNNISKTYGFECITEKFNIFPQGTFMTHLEEILNPIARDFEFNIMNYNISGIKYILDKIISHLLIERYIKWLEVIQYPEKYKYIYPDDCIPMYVAKIPKNSNEEISFYFPDNRIDHMKSVIQDISENYACPFNQRKHYPPYKSPIDIVLGEISRF